MYEPLKYTPTRTDPRRRGPEIDCIEIRSNPDVQRGLFDAVADRLWWVVAGVVIALVMM